MYCPRTTFSAANGWTLLSTFTRSSRKLSMLRVGGGSMAMFESICSKWFCTTSRTVPTAS